MNNAISNLRTHCSQIIKLILFFYSGGPRFLFFLFFLSFSYPSFFLISHSCFEPPTISLLSLSLPLLDVFASLSDETQAGASSQVDLYCSGFFFFFFLLFDGKFGSGCVGYGFGILDRHSTTLCGLWVEVLGH